MLIVILNKDPFWISKLQSQQEEYQGSTGRETWATVKFLFHLQKKKEVKIVVDIIAIHFREQIIA